MTTFDHHPDPAIDFCCEVEELENIAENARLGLTGLGHEEDRATLDKRVQRAMEFRVGADQAAVLAKAALRQLATTLGYHLSGEISYAGQPIPRADSPR